VPAESDPVIQTVPLGTPWPTIDPFLFCVHHHDDYPVADGRHGPDASLAGRDLGQDFSGRDGWSMYHGRTVPGFPQHPHRGFETVTVVRTGLIDHADSLGAAARYGEGDVQWLTAGAGVVHAEMFPLLHTDGPNPLELFQIWLNLPAADKFADPHFTMLWSDELPRLAVVDDEGRTGEVTVVAGTLESRTPPNPPPSSWASRPEADVAIWHIELSGGARWTLPSAAGPDTARVVYVFDGDHLVVGPHEVAAGVGAVVRCDRPVEVTAGPQGCAALVLQGRPIGEPVVSYGPFVMNTEAQIRDAFEDYRRTGFGGWPWPDDDPVHGDDPARFARRPDGPIERPAG